jgi:transcriptional regulator with XRE-family HTH domain
VRPIQPRQHLRNLGQNGAKIRAFASPGLVFMAQKFALLALGNAVRAARRNAGLTQAKAAQLAGVGSAAVRAIERGCGRVRTLTAVLGALRLELRGRGLTAGPVGLALRGARKRRHQSRRKLAMVLGLSRNTLAAIEQGGGLVSALEAYAGAVGARLYVGGIGDERAFYTHAGNSSAHHGWETPADLGAALSLAVGGFDLDPCAPSRDGSVASEGPAALLISSQKDGQYGDATRPTVLDFHHDALPNLAVP